MSREDLIDLVIPEGTTEIGAYAFAGGRFTSVTIPNSVTNIGDHAFEDCVNLPSVELPSSLQSVGESAFRNCDALTAIGLPDAVRSVGAYAFYDCSRLKDVSLSKNLESLPDHVFDACPQLDSIYVPASVAQLGSHVFGGAMRSVYFIGNAPAYNAGVYASTGGGLMTYVKYGTKGWDGRPNSRDLPQKWPTDNPYGRGIMTWDPVQFDVTFDAGWSLTPGGAAVYADRATIPGLGAIEDGIIDLYAVWTSIRSLISFNANGGTGTMASLAMNPTGVYKLPKCTLTPPKGKTRFAGWAGSNGKRYDDEMLVFNLGDVTLTAIWQ